MEMAEAEVKAEAEAEKAEKYNRLFPPLRFLSFSPR